MRLAIAITLVLTLAGCAELDKVRARFAPRPEPKSFTIIKQSGPEDCSFPWQRDLPRADNDDLVVGDVVIEGLLDRRPAWWYEPAGAVAHHLRAGERPRGWSRADAAAFAGEAEASGGFVATNSLVDLRAKTFVVISVPEDDPNVALLPAGPHGFGGDLPENGVKSIRCQAGDLDTSFHIGFVVAGPRCVPVTVGGDTRRVPFGADC
jgi:hypothetical protein